MKYPERLRFFRATPGRSRGGEVGGLASAARSLTPPRHGRNTTLMAVIPVAQPSRDSLVALLANRALDVLKDAGFQRVLRQEGWRFLVAVSSEARAAWLRTAGS